MVTEERVPSYEAVKEKIKQIDNTIIIYRVFYNFDNLSYRFQLIKKDKMCIVEISKTLLDELKNNGSSSDQKLAQILKLNTSSSDCWNKVDQYA
ncbi:MAG TPA: hypothetical protein ENH40_05745 [Nitrospirae bacterium]|nr:hypothetical protein [Nitrospirota bacterium]